jgi:hypothetical protein
VWAGLPASAGVLELTKVIEWIPVSRQNIGAPSSQRDPYTFEDTMSWIKDNFSLFDPKVVIEAVGTASQLARALSGAQTAVRRR